MDDELLAFVREALARGRSRAEVAEVLRRAGWSGEQLAAALGAFAEVDFPVPVPMPRPYLSARDAFLYLVLFSALYFSAYHLGRLIFDLVNAAFPDPATDHVRSAYVRQGMRWSVAALIVAFPVFLFMSRLINREIQRDPGKRRSKIRRWLTYVTLFVGACVLIGDVTALIYNLLGGELTVRFGLKAAAVALIAGAIFAYYLEDLRLEERDGRPASWASPGLAGGAATAIAGAAILAALILIGAPAEQRLDRLDERRLADLRRVSSAVDVYWTRRGKLPASLEQLAAEPGVTSLPRDRATGAPFEYHPADGNAYQLCANFETASDEDDPRFWLHPSGRHCFSLEARQVQR